MRVLKIGAVLSVAIGGLSLLFLLWTAWPFSLQEYIVARKYTSPSGSSAQYRLYAEISPGGSALDSSYSRSFYNTAQVGDRLRTTMTGYSTLIRDGHVIKRHVSEELLIPAGYCLIAFSTGLAFVRVASRCARWACHVWIGLAEIITIGGLLISLFAPCW